MIMRENLGKKETDRERERESKGPAKPTSHAPAPPTNKQHQQRQWTQAKVSASRKERKTQEEILLLHINYPVMR
jgi:hypothetical protein